MRCRRAIAWLAFFLTLAAWHIHIDKTGDRNYFFNSDMLTLETLYRDVVAGADLSTWRLSGAPSFFPDMPLYFGIRAVIPPLHWSVLAYGLALFMLTTAGWIAVARFIKIDEAFVILGIAVGSWIAALGTLHVSSLYFLANTSHSGILMLMPWALLLTLQLATEPWTPRRIVLLWLLMFLASASDNLFIPQVAAPLCVLFLFYAWRRKTTWKASAAFIALAASAIAGGAMGAKAIVRYSVMANYVKAGAVVSPELRAAYLAWWQELWRRWPVHAAIVVLFLLVAAVVLVRSRREDADLAAGGFAVFCLAGAAANFAVLVAAGMADAASVTRYMMATFYIPIWWGWPFIVRAWAGCRMWMEGARGRFAAAALALVVIAATLPWMRDVKRLAHYAHYDPKDVRSLDHQLAKRHLHNGIADYWSAKYVTCLSRHDVRLAQVLSSLAPFFWVNNWASFRMEPDFVVVDTEQHSPDHHLDPQRIVEHFGPPADYFVCGRYLVLVYDRPSDRDFHRLFAGLGDKP